MKKLFAFFFLLAVLSSTAFAQDTYINGYYRNDGTYVEPHYRSRANNNVYDNYSSQGNINPYTGQQGTVDPYQGNANQSSGYAIPQRSYTPERRGSTYDPGNSPYNNGGGRLGGSGGSPFKSNNEHFKW